MSVPIRIPDRSDNMLSANNEDGAHFTNREDLNRKAAVRVDVIEGTHISSSKNSSFIVWFQPVMYICSSIIDPIIDYWCSSG